MLDRIHRAADTQLARQMSSDEAVAACQAAGVSMSNEAATTLLQEDTLRTVGGIKASADSIDVTGALRGVNEAINRLTGFEEVHMDIAPFLWAPTPIAMRGLAVACGGKPRPTETYGVAGWSIKWRDELARLGETTLFLFQNNDEFTDGAVHAAVVRSHTPLPGKDKEPILEGMLREGSENARRMALAGILRYAKPIHGQMKALAEQKLLGNNDLPPTKKYLGGYENAAMYSMGVILENYDLHKDPVRHLHALSLLYEGDYHQLAIELGRIKEWPTDRASHRRSLLNPKRPLVLSTAAPRTSGEQSEEYLRMYGHLNWAQDTNTLLLNGAVFNQAIDTPAWQFQTPPWLYRSSDHGETLQSAFALPPAEHRRRMFGRTAGGIVGKQAIALATHTAPLAQQAHKQIQDLVSAAYLKELGI